ncbi:DUF445 family protein [Bacillus spongiae]|uniref:DUF445 family protein n=1 Tax=Bacillus spongiae TaxID=2683610 RepID=A0ABU8HAW0_9BACI
MLNPSIKIIMCEWAIVDSAFYVKQNKIVFDVRGKVEEIVKEVIMILFMIGIGAVIGGVTNSLAIKMLFRPYVPMYIGRWRVPFTPGLIPKRRGELADQLGSMVVEHLLTPESIQKRILDDTFSNELTQWAKDEVKQLKSSTVSLEELLEKVGVNQPEDRIHELTERWMMTKYQDFKLAYQNTSILQTLPPELEVKIEEKLPFIVDLITDKGIQYFSSEEGKAKIKVMIDDFLAERGMLGGMLQMFLGNTSVVDRVQPELIKFLRHTGTRQLILRLITNEWEKVKHTEWKILFENVEDDKVMNTISQTMRKIVDVKGLLAISLGELIAKINEKHIDTLVPIVVTKGVEKVSHRLPRLLEKLKVQELVKDQVDSFSTQRLEKMVLDISKSELKMITFLGALLGGTIGFVQGVIVLLLK